MEIDQFTLVVQFCVRIAVMLVITGVALKLARVLARPCGTYGDGLPERRARRRIVLRDPATIPLLEATSGAMA
jgi:hypothetical protein